MDFEYGLFSTGGGDFPGFGYGVTVLGPPPIDPVSLDWNGGDTFEGDNIGLGEGAEITTWSGAKGRRLLEQTGATNLKPVFRSSPDRADYDGIDDDNIVDSGAVNGTELSVSFVTRNVNIAATQRLLYMNNAQRITISSVGALVVEIRTVDDGYVSTNTAALTGWPGLKHIGVTYDGATIRVYVDGSEVATNTATGALAPRAGFLHHVGSVAGSIQFFDGEILHYGYATEVYPEETFLGISKFYGVV